MNKLKQILSDKADIIGGLALILLPLLTALVESENGCIDITAVIMFSPLGLYLLFGNKNNMEE